MDSEPQRASLYCELKDAYADKMGDKKGREVQNKLSPCPVMNTGLWCGFPEC